MRDIYLKPAHIEHRRYSLCGLDLVFGFHYSDTVIFLSADFDIARIEPALLKTIEQIPVLAGKLVKDGEGIALDTDGPGLQLSFETATEKAPPHGDDIFPIGGYNFFNAVSNVLNAPLSESPLMSIKVTTFADGILGLGIRHNHALLDGTSFYAFLMVLDAHLHHLPTGALQFDRSAVLAMAKTGVELPSLQSGIRATTEGLVAGRPMFFKNRFATVGMAAAEYQRLAATVRESLNGVISVNDLMQALVFKAFGLSSGQSDGEPAIANLSFDVRRVKESPLPMNYFGNGVLFRRLELSFGELRSISLLDLAKRFRQAARPDLDSIAQDIGFYQGQYAAGNYNSRGVYSSFAPVLGNGGLYLNNMLSLMNMPEFNLGGAEIGAGAVLPAEFGVRLAMLMPNKKKDVLLRLALEPAQIEMFKEHWSALLKQLLRQGLARN